MGLFEWLFGWLFRERKKAGKTEMWELEKTLFYVEEACAEDAKSLEKEIFSRLSEVKHLLKTLDSAIDEARRKNVSLDEGNFGLRRIVVTSRDGLLNRFSQLSKKLEPPKTTMVSEIYGYAVSSKKIVREEVIQSRKNIAYSKALLAEEIKAIGKELEEIDRVFSSMQESFEKNRVAGLAEFRKHFSGLESAIKEREALEEECKKGLALVNDAALKAKRLSIDIDELMNSSFAHELSDIEAKYKALFDEKGALRQKFLAVLEKVDKPLTRFLKIAASSDGVVPHEERDLANSYFQNVLVASKRDPKGEQLKKILSRVLAMVEDGTISMKEKEKEKRVQALREVMEYDFFSEVFWKLNSLESEILGVERRISEFPLNKKISDANNELSSAKRELSSAQETLERLNQKKKQAESGVLAAKGLAEKLAGRITENQVIIKID
ncbi:MAG: hypothetical protein HY392_03760 [Candidatus Diapherotrites archaeon]|nr:hypothetical protein [Candidatus Diapherotrites archaeon]